MKEIILVVSGLILGVVALASLPLLTIAALNTLFSTGIAYSFINWLSMLWIQFLLVSPKAIKLSN